MRNPARVGSDSSGGIPGGFANADSLGADFRHEDYCGL